MYCPDCGSDLTGGNVKCESCGWNRPKEGYNTFKKIKEILKNRKGIVIIGAIIALICVIIAFSGSGNIDGSWEVAERSANENLNGYPEDDFVIYENGSFTADGVGGTYSVNDDIITLNFSMLGFYTYEYDISGNTLILRNVNDTNEREIYYERRY